MAARVGYRTRFCPQGTSPPAFRTRKESQMKRLATTALLALLASAALTTAARATVLMSDSFTYPNGDLTANATWAVYSGTPPTDIQVISGRAVCNHNNAPDDHRLFAVQPTTSKTYACFDVIVPNPGVPGNPKPVYFALLKDAGTSNFVSRVYVVPVNSGGFTFAISHSSTGTTAGCTVWSAGSLLYDHRYNIVINYDPVNHSSKLWVDPVNELSTNVTDTNAAITALAVAGFGFRQSGTASTAPGFGTAGLNITESVDNLGVGTTFDDACQLYHTVPATKSTWSYVKSVYR